MPQNLKLLLVPQREVEPDVVVMAPIFPSATFFCGSIRNVLLWSDNGGNASGSAGGSSGSGSSVSASSVVKCSSKAKPPTVDGGRVDVSESDSAVL